MPLEAVVGFLEAETFCYEWRKSMEKSAAKEALSEVKKQFCVQER